MSRRVFVSLLLLLAILPLLGLISNAPVTQGQAFTTITTYTTKPTTITSARATIIRLTSTTTVTRSDMTTSSCAQSRNLFSGTILLSAPGPNFGCYVDNRRFGAKKGEVVSVSIESDNEFSLYFMTEKDFKA